jgi:ABC-type Mn2+/Zn2+ transport system ATPase subunit
MPRAGFSIWLPVLMDTMRGNTIHLGGSPVASSVSPAIEISDLTAGYGAAPVLVEVSLAISAGSQTAVVGPNGAGKSTLFKALVNMLPATNGQVLVDGQPLHQQLRKIAYVPQREEVDWRFPVTVLDVVLMGRYGRIGWLRRPGREDRAVALRCLEQIGITQLARSPIGALSGGQQQRVFLARALAQEPRILILDEPFAGVDSPTQEAVLELLASLRGHGVTLLVSTHDLALATSRFDSLLLLNRRVIAHGPPTEVISAETLSAAFGAQVLFYGSGGGLLAVADHCCPPGLNGINSAERKAGGR